jgi:hypothetical protein
VSALRRFAATIDRRTLRRALLAFAIVLCIGVSIALVRSNAALAQARSDNANTQGWRNASRALPTATIESVVATWSMRRETNADSSSLNWTVADVTDLRASLLALDAVPLKLQKISIGKRDSGFTITAELLP